MHWLLRSTLYLLAAMAVAACHRAARPGEAVSSTGGTVTNCSKSAEVGIDNNEYIVQTNEWNSSQRQCLDIGGSTVFTVTQASFDLPTNGGPATYPSVFKGCHWGSCTNSSTSCMPIQVSAMPTVTSSWSTTQTGAGAYDAAYDIWFNRTATTIGQPDGAELMIWLAEVGGIGSAGAVVGTVLIGGATWNVWKAQMASWTYIAYLRTPVTTSVSNLDVRAFVQDAVSRGYISPSWFLIDIEAGFEIWKGGQGLATTSFTASVGSGSRCGEHAKVTGGPP